MSLNRTIEFPADFVFGSAAAAHQVEGNNAHNDWWAHEHAADTNAIEPSGIACDHYRSYPEHIALMRNLGVRSYRFSVAWPRLLPAGRGTVNALGLGFYDRLIDALLAAESVDLRRDVQRGRLTREHRNRERLNVFRNAEAASIKESHGLGGAVEHLRSAR